MMLLSARATETTVFRANAKLTPLNVIVWWILP